MTNAERKEFNRNVFLVKMAQLMDELNTRMDGNTLIECMKLGNEELTADELKIKAKQFFIKELSRQLTNLL